MTRFELTQILAEKQSQLSIREVERSVKCVFDCLANALATGHRIEIRRFGSFSIRLRPERIARNPKTGETIRKPSKYSVHFKPGKEMRDRVNILKANDFRKEYTTVQ
jgi:integration host factor subunit beta